MKRKTIHKYRWLIHSILLEDRNARNSDKELWLQIIEILMPETSTMPFKKAIMVTDFPSYDSVSRIRRYWQQRDPRCMSDEKFARYRAEHEEECRQFFGLGERMLEDG